MFKSPVWNLMDNLSENLPIKILDFGGRGGDNT